MEPLKEVDLSKVELDKFINWYEGITIALQSYTAKRKRLDRLEKICDYLGKRCFRNILSGHHTFSKKLSEYFNKEKENIYPEIRNLIMYTDDILMDGISGLESNPYFIPTLTDWEWLHFCRPSYLKDNKAQYLIEFQTSILKDRDFASLKLDGLFNDIFNSDFYGNVTFGGPILKSVIAGNTFNDVSGWKLFCNWISEIDYAKWLLEKTKAAERYESIITPTIAGVILLFHYLSDNNGESLYAQETLEKASTKYNLSKSRIKRELSKFRPNEIIMVGSTTNEKMAKLNQIQFTVTELKKLRNHNALNEALRDLNIIKEKLNY